jgi:hypothetical protein
MLALSNITSEIATNGAGVFRMSQKETREQLLAALTACIEQAPDKASEPLFRAYEAFVAARGDHGMRQLGRTPLVMMLLESIEDGLAHHAMEEEMQREAQS